MLFYCISISNNFFSFIIFPCQDTSRYCNEYIITVPSYEKCLLLKLQVFHQLCKCHYFLTVFAYFCAHTMSPTINSLSLIFPPSSINGLALISPHFVCVYIQFDIVAIVILQESSRKLTRNSLRLRYGRITKKNEDNNFIKKFIVVRFLHYAWNSPSYTTKATIIALDKPLPQTV